jgi:hypothetical protein
MGEDGAAAGHSETRAKLDTTPASKTLTVGWLTCLRTCAEYVLPTMR